MSAEPTKTYTQEEISQHSTKDSLWLLIDNIVYDVTKFQNEHPGGEETLLDWAGKDATDAFEDVNHSSDARTLMKDYEIGELKEEDQKGKKKANGTSSCFDLRYVAPLGVVIVAAILYKVYSHFGK